MIELTISGLSELGSTLSVLHRRFTSAPGPATLQRLGQRMASSLRANIETGGRRLADRGIRWRPLAPYTVRYKALHGYDPRPLIRTGAMLASIETDQVTADRVSAGPDTPYVRYVDAVRPFVLPSLADVDDWMLQLAEHYFGGL